MKNRIARTVAFFLALIMTTAVFFSVWNKGEDVQAATYITFTFKWSSIDGESVKDDYTIQWPIGWTWSGIVPNSDIYDMKDYFKDVDGYHYYGIHLKPMTDYEDYVFDDYGRIVESAFPAPVGETYREGSYRFDHDTTFYVWMLKEIDTVELECDAPLCGQKIELKSETKDGKTTTYQSNIPAVKSNELHPEAIETNWVVPESDYDLYEGDFTGGETYVGFIYAYAPFGYTYSNENIPTVTGKDNLFDIELLDLDELYRASYDSVYERHIIIQFKIKAEHDYGKPTYKWSSDNKSVTASMKCSSDDDTIKETTKDVTVRTIKESTQTVNGTERYTAAFKNPTFKTQTKDVTLPKLDITPTPKIPNPPPKPSEAGVSGFVERLYTIALGRASDQGGKADWVNRVMTQGKTGADIAYGFLYSPEFLNKGLSNEDFLEVLYKVFFDRASDAPGKADWLGRMANGWTKQQVIKGFIDSTEWANVCLKFGIPSGGNGTPNATIEPNEKVIAFATRLYKTCLGRDPEPEGLKNWSLQLANMKVSGTAAAYGFFFSDELTKQGLTNEEFVMRLYRTFMDREADQGGFMYWLGKFGEGATREDVFYGFANSPEFRKICADYGILR